MALATITVADAASLDDPSVTLRVMVPVPAVADDVYGTTTALAIPDVIVATFGAELHVT